MIKKLIFSFTVLLIFLYPFSFKAGASNGKKIDVIILDAGHGGKDPGTIGITGIYEKDIVLPITLKVRDLLEKNYQDIKVILTRDDDSFPKLEDRGKIANENQGNLFVSIHCNAKISNENDKDGFEIYIEDLTNFEDGLNITQNENLVLKTGKKDIKNNYIISSIAQNSYLKCSERFAAILQNEMVKNTQILRRGVFQKRLYVLYGASMPSVLIECGYLSNKKDEAYLKSDKGKTETAYSIYKAIRFFKFDYDFENK